MAVPATTRIAVIGAGPAGLTCARILQRNGLNAIVYDLETGPEARNQGGTLDLHEDNGQIALREAGLLDAFLAACRPEGQEMRQMAPDGTTLFHHTPEQDELFKPEIDRGHLRDLLLESLTPGTIQWGRTLAAVDGPPSGPRQLRFTDGTTAEADLVVGADGAWSKVRRAISPAMPQYSGISFLEAWFHDVENTHPDIVGLIGQGSAAAADGERGLFAQRNSGNHIRVYIIQRVPQNWITDLGLAIHDTDAIRAHLLDQFEAWSPRLQRLITDNDGLYVHRPIHALPVPHSWKHDPTITLLGDAAHLMPPLGVGVNLAMLDASELALALVNNDSVDSAIHAYESTMLPRSHDIQKALDHGAEELVSDELPDFATEIP